MSPSGFFKLYCDWVHTARGGIKEERSCEISITVTEGSKVVKIHITRLIVLVYVNGQVYSETSETLDEK